MGIQRCDFETSTPASTGNVSKTLCYRLFKAGRVPKHVEAQIEKEGVVLREEGIGGSVTYRNFRAPGRYSSWRRKWFTGSIVLTNAHFLAFRYSTPILGVPWKDRRIKALDCFLKGDEILCVAFDAALFNDDWSGDVEVRFRTSRAQSFLEVIQTQVRSASRG